MSKNGIKMVASGIEAMTKLVSACTAIYAIITSGAMVDAVTTVVSKMNCYFFKKQ